MKGYVNPEYLDFIREQPCSVSTEEVRAEPHHLQTIGMGGKRGINQSGSDLSAIPLSYKLHVEIGQIGVTEFQKRHHCDVWKIAWECVAKYVEKKEP